ncbi:MAG: hypothetical protein HQL96_06330 [Magnetococcales bacterium]|nr:hypothetical protein [Magnetococcales bacterium]
MTTGPKTRAKWRHFVPIVGNYVDHYNNVRLHSAIGFIALEDRLEGRQQEIWDARDDKREAAREAKATRRKSSNTTLQSAIPDPENQGKSQE